MKDKLYGLDLFSGIGGNTIALREWVKTVAYCEADRHAQSVLLSRMGDRSIKSAPIWDDITTLKGDMFDVSIDIIIAGFPCQDISVAGKGAGLAGKRSGLFFEVMRLAKEVKPTFIFLENVPAIRTRGLDVIIQELTEAGYDSRWCMLSAAETGAPHKRERWFLLAYSRSLPKPQEYQSYDSLDQQWAKVGGREQQSSWTGASNRDFGGHSSPGNETNFALPQGSGIFTHLLDANISQQPPALGAHWWSVEPGVGRVAHGVSQRVDRIKRLGNAVVPAQAKEAFEILMGIKNLWNS